MTANRQTVVGAFVLGGVILALAAVVMFGKLDVFNPSIRAAVVFQGSIAGLSVGAPVTFRGVRVGAVENIAIQFDAKSATAFIPVQVRIDPGQALASSQEVKRDLDLPHLVSQGLRAELNVQSFVTGQSQIDLDFDPTSPAVLHPEVTHLPEIPTKQSTLQRAQEQLSQLPLRELAQNTQAMLQSLRGLTEKLDNDLPPLVDSLKTTSDHSQRAVDAVQSAIVSLQGKMERSLDDVSQLAETGDRQLTQRGADLHTVLVSSNQTMQQVRDLLGNLQTLTSTRSGTRANIDSTLRDLAAAAASLRGFANDVEHNPQLLLTGRRQ